MVVEPATQNSKQLTQAFLASDAGRNTGQWIAVDGGITLGQG
jgi:hypothetical protein